MKIDMRYARQIGVELEFPLYDKTTGAALVAGRYVRDTKEKPRAINGIMLHKDASMVEVALPPCANAHDLAVIMHQGEVLVDSVIPFDVYASPKSCAVAYSDEELEMDPYASELGCSASRNVHRLPPLGKSYHDNVRYAGIHLNIETDNPTEIDALFLDVFVGLYSVIHWEQHDREAIVKRRQNYGKAGEYRVKSFGIEYRTLPISVLHTMNVDIMWDQVNKALEVNPDSDFAGKVYNASAAIMSAIQDCDRELALDIYKKLELQNDL